MRKKFLFFVIVLQIFSSTKCQNLIGLLQNLVNLDFDVISLNTKCRSELVVLKNDLQNREVWALKALDASSFIGSDFVWGNNIAPGSPRSCGLVSKPTHIPKDDYTPKSIRDLTQIGSPFPLVYRVLHARHQSTLQFDIQMIEKDVLDMGFCIPATCLSVDATNLFTSFLQDEEFLNRTLLEKPPEILSTKTLELSNDFFKNPFVLAFFIIFSIMLGLIVLEYLYTTCKSHLYKFGSFDSIEIQKREENIFEKILSSFSVHKNTKLLFSNKTTSKSLPVLNGIKAIAMFFFLVGHFALFGASGITNIQQIYVFMDNIWLQPLFSMHIFVDTFYVIAAILLSYYYFEHVKDKDVGNGFLTFIKMGIKRFLRLTPLYLISMCLVVTMDKVMKDLSPFYLMDDNEFKCQRDWWRNALYISNYQDFSSTCMIWSYYLSNDFQLYLIGSILVIIATKRRVFAIGLFTLLLAAAIGTSGYFAYSLPFAFTLHAMYATGKYLYTPIWIRLPPYLAGLVTGWYLSQRDRTLGLNKKWIPVLWTVASLFLIAMIYSHWGGNVSKTCAVLFVALGRLAWGVAISWMVLACSTGHGGLIDNILSSKFFLPFSRLTYAAYLINPIWSQTVIMFNDTPIHIDYGMLPMYTVGIVVTVYAAAAVFCILFEIPFTRLFKLMGF